MRPAFSTQDAGWYPRSTAVHVPDESNALVAALLRLVRLFQAAESVHCNVIVSYRQCNAFTKLADAAVSALDRPLSRSDSREIPESRAGVVATLLVF